MYNETVKLQSSVPLANSSLISDPLTAWQMHWKSNDTLTTSPAARNPYPIGLLIEWYSFDESNINATKGSFTEREMTLTHRRSVQGLECIPGYGRYIANLSFSNGDPTIKINTTYVGSLDDFWNTATMDYRWEYIGDPSLDGSQSLFKIVNFQSVILSLFDPLVGQISNFHNIEALADGTMRLSDLIFSKMPHRESKIITSAETMK